MRFSCSFLALTLWALWLACDLFLISTAERLGWFAFWGSREEGQDWREGKDLDFVPGGKSRGTKYMALISRE